MVYLWSEPIVCVGTYLIYHQSAKQHISIKGPVALCAYYKDGFYIAGLLDIFQNAKFFSSKCTKGMNFYEIDTVSSSQLPFLM